jgi:nucleotide-binding universal stress UspA family protein
MIVLKNVLVATDFSEPSNAALAYGRSLARQFGARLHVLYVVEDLGARIALPLPVGDLGQMQIEAEQSAKARLEDWLAGEDREIEVVPAVITSTSPSREIIDYAIHTMPRIDLIVMGTHGRGMMGHLFMGSVAERVVRGAPCPVLTVRHPEHEFVMPDALQTVSQA